MAQVARNGKPDYFITMTFNPKCKEMAENLRQGQQPSDRPDLIARIFVQKLKHLLDDLFKKHVMGKVKSLL